MCTLSIIVDYLLDFFPLLSQLPTIRRYIWQQFQCFVKLLGLYATLCFSFSDESWGERFRKQKPASLSPNNYKHALGPGESVWEAPISAYSQEFFANSFMEPWKPFLSQLRGGDRGGDFKLLISSGKAIEVAFQCVAMDRLPLRSAQRYANTICSNI